MYYFKRLFLILLFLHILPVYAMESEFENIFAATGLFWGLEVMSILYNRYKVEAELEHAIMQADESNFAAKDVDAIKKCLDKDIDPNCKIGVSEKTVLMFAIEHSNRDLLKYLLKKNNVDLNASDNFGWTPLHYAMELHRNDLTKCNAQKICKKLLKLRADPNKITRWVAPPLFFANLQNYNNIIKLLVQYNANINDKKAFGITPLAHALECHSSLETIKELCKARASFYNIHYNNSAFHVAVDKIHSKEYIQALMKYGHLGDDNIIHQKQTENIITRTLKTLFGNQQPTALGFDRSHQNQDKSLKETAIETLLILRQLKINPYCQFYILSHVALLSTFYDFNEKLCGYLFNIGYKKPFIFHINNQVQNIIKILQVKNDEHKTALDLLNATQNSQYKNEVKSLIDAHELQKNLNDFNTVVSCNKLILDSNNVIPQIFGFKLN